MCVTVCVCAFVCFCRFYGSPAQYGLYSAEDLLGSVHKTENKSDLKHMLV